MKPLILFGDTHLFHKSALFKALRAVGATWIDGNGLGAPRKGAYIAWLKYCDCDVARKFARAMDGRAVLNAGFQSDKRNVQAHSEKTLGYSERVDPLTWSGDGVVKSRRNARHDGKVTRFPIAAIDEAKCYGRLIDNRIDADTVRDIRVPMLLGSPIIAYTKDRPIRHRFVNDGNVSKIVAPEAMLSADELSCLAGFCGSIGLDYGDLDLCRDRNTGRLYVVDANNTPRGPPPNLPPGDTEQAIETIGRAWIERVLTRDPC